MKQYLKHRDIMSTGDIILFSGKGLFSSLIKWRTNSPWSHVGMVIRLDEYDFVGLWESTTLSDLTDLDTGVPRKGVQVVPLSLRIANYDGEIAFRKLNQYDYLEEELNEIVMRLRQEFKGKQYETSENELLKAVYDGPFGKNKQDLSSLFCSELVAEAYRELGFLPSHVSSNEYTPADFAQDHILGLSPTCDVGSIVMLKGEV